jgi:hypothetical protein
MVVDTVRGGMSERRDFNNGDFGVANGKIGVEFRIARMVFFPNFRVCSR